MAYASLRFVSVCLTLSFVCAVLAQVSVADYALWMMLQLVETRTNGSVFKQCPTLKTFMERFAKDHQGAWQYWQGVKKNIVQPQQQQLQQQRTA